MKQKMVSIFVFFALSFSSYAHIDFINDDLSDGYRIHVLEENGSVTKCEFMMIKANYVLNWWDHDIKASSFYHVLQGENNCNFNPFGISFLERNGKIYLSFVLNKPTANHSNRLDGESLRIINTEGNTWFYAGDLGEGADPHNKIEKLGILSKLR